MVDVIRALDLDVAGLLDGIPMAPANAASAPE